MPTDKDDNIKKILKIEINNKGFSSLISIRINLSILIPSLKLLSLLIDPSGLGLYKHSNSPTLNPCSRAWIVNSASTSNSLEFWGKVFMNLF